MKGMLLTEVGPETASSLVEDSDWVMEQKHDGTRAMIRLNADGTWVAYQRGGGVLSHSAATQHLEAIVADLKMALPDEWGVEALVDGELMIRTGEFRVFDVPVIGERGLFRSWEERRRDMEALLKGAGRAVVLSRVAYDGTDKEDLLRRAGDRGAEGVVLKRRTSAYAPGLRGTDWLKFKFVKTADVVVTSVSRSRNAAGREVGSIGFALLGADGAHAVTGSCSAIGKPHVEVGDVIEVAYLYREPGGTLIQPRMRQVRSDKQPHECTIDQIPSYTREAL